MHLGQARHQVAAVALDDVHSLGRIETLGGVDRRDPPVGDHDGLVFEDPVPVHRQDVHADKRQISLDDRRRIPAPARGKRARGDGHRGQKPGGAPASRPASPGARVTAGTPTSTGAPASRPATSTRHVDVHSFTSGRTRAYFGTCPRLYTMNVRLNVMTTVPSCLNPRVRTVTIPTFGRDFDSRVSSTSLSE